MDTLPMGHFAYWTVRLLFGHFAYWTLPTGHFTYKTFCLLHGQFASRLIVGTKTDVHSLRSQVCQNQIACYDG